jgi:AcrR family transcriptional regulator
MPQSRTARRAEGLSRDVVVAAAVDLLDEHGERGLTFKVLTERLRTGAGAVYWHVANKDELVTLAADRVIGEALAGAAAAGDDPQERLRTLALAVYDALDRHPWAGPRIGVLPMPVNTLRLLDRIGTLLTGTALPSERLFAVATLIFRFVTGIAAQDDARATAMDPGTTRNAHLGQEADRWAALDPEAFPFLTHAAAELRDHDDREQFITGFDLLLDGLRLQRG